MILPINPTFSNIRLTKIGQIISFSEKNLTFYLKLFINESEIPENLSALLINHKGQFVPFFIKNLELSGEKAIRISFEEINKPEQAGELMQAEVYTDIRLKASPKTIPLFARNDNLIFAKLFTEPELLIGYSLQDQRNVCIGTISNYYRTPGQILLSLEVNGKECLVPFLKEFFIEVDEEKKIVSMEVLDGLIDS